MERWSRQRLSQWEAQQTGNPATLRYGSGGMRGVRLDR